MSGDVQPRKRKDKKRKREEDSVPLSFYPKDVSEDVNIHVHKDEGTGGGLCAKIIFFILFSALIVLIGLIITEHRGLTDLDVAESESRYSQIFEGWVDNDKHDHHHTLDDHDNEHFDDEEDEHGDGHTLDDHDDDHIDDEPSEEQEHTLDDHDDQHFDDDDDTSQPPSDENEDEEPSNEENEKILRYRYTREMSEENEEDNVTESQPDDETEEEEMTAASPESETKEEEEDEYEARDEDEEENVTDSQQYSEDGAEENDDEQVSQEAQNDFEDRTFSEEDEISDRENEDEAELKDDDEVKESKEDEENRSEGENVDYDDEVQSQEKPEQQPDKETEESENKQKDEPASDDAVADIPGLFNMIVKAIIGASILAVGHFVLVKKWKSGSSEDDSKKNFEQLNIDLSRRNTLIPPPTLQEIEQEVENASEEFSYEDEEPEIIGVTDIAKENYEHLRKSYSRSISPESDEDGRNEEDIEDFEVEELEEEVEEEEDEEIEDENQEEEIDDQDYDDDDYEEEDDDALMKKLEAKYGKLQVEPKGRQISTDQDDSDSEKLSEDNNEYEYSTITNEDDWVIHKELDEAQKNLPNNAAKALKMFEKILEKYPSSPRGLYGLASSLDNLAESKRSNELLEEAVTNYIKISNIINVPDQLFKTAMERCIDRLRFRGRYGRVVTVHLKLIERFPEQVKYRNQLVVSYLTMGRDHQARLVLEETLRKWPTDGCALVHYGFIWKTTYNNLKKGLYYMKKGIETSDPCAIDGRFFFHLGDALFKLGHKKEALMLYENGVEHKLFLSKYQRSLYNVPRLTARPWWDEKQFNDYKLFFGDLKKNWEIIRDEGLSVLNEKGFFQDESENLRNTGEWKQFELFARGKKHVKNCYKTPSTCRIIENHPFASGCRRGQTKFSVMHPGTHVWAHCGPTNCRLRVHLGLKVPTQTFIRVSDEIRSWKDGKLLIFDDSFEHEVWHNGTDIRLVLIVDVWHPELSITERKTLSSL